MTTRWLGYLFTVIAGAIMPLAFAPFALYPVALFAPAVLFALWLRATPLQGLLLGGLFGIGMFGTGVNWIFISIHDHGYVNLWLSIFITSLFIIVLSIFPAMAGYCAVRYRSWASSRIDGITSVLVFPAVWVLFEWIRGWFLTGFPWLNLGYSMIDTPLAGWAPLSGIYGVSLASAFCSALLMATFGLERYRVRGGYVILIICIWLAGASLLHVAWTRPDGPPVKVAVVQGNIPQDLKWHPEMRQPTFDLYTSLTEKHWDNDLIIWPETALPAFYNEARAYLNDLGKEARAHHSDLLVGLLYLDPVNQRYYNTMVSIGTRERLYHKQHLVPFTEYLPLKSVLAEIVDFMNVPMSNFSAGSAGQPLLQAAGHKIGMSICFEDAFGEEIIHALPEATMLVNVSNDAWFGNSIAPHQHLQMARMRALESGRPLIRATNTGVSATIDHKGRIQAAAPQFTEFVLSAKVQPMAGATPYVRVGNYPAVITICLMLVVAFFVGRANKKGAVEEDS